MIEVEYGYSQTGSMTMEKIVDDARSRCRPQKQGGRAREHR